MLETFRNAWKIEDLRKRLLFTLLILVLFRLGCALCSAAQGRSSASQGRYSARQASAAETLTGLRLRPPASTSAKTPPGPIRAMTTVEPSASGLLAVIAPSSTRPTSWVS